MSFETSSKRSHVAESMGDAKRENTRSNDGIAGCFTNIPVECCVRILQFLEVEDLANVAQVSRRFNEDIMHSSLPQNRTATLTCVRRIDGSTGVYSASFVSLFQTLMEKGVSDKSWRFNKVKIKGHNLLEDVWIPGIRNMLQNMLPGATTLQHVTVLDLSFPSNALKKGTEIPAGILNILGRMMPFLREINLSNASVSDSSFLYFVDECRTLENITWNNNHESTWILGNVFMRCNNLKELYMDDSIFFSATVVEAALEDEGNRVCCILYRCNTKLERVSLKNLKISDGHRFNTTPHPLRNVSQAALVKFVRLTPSLRWFRSDLIPENVAVLQAERPEVTFA
jgi:hypothetical protein